MAKNTTIDYYSAVNVWDSTMAAMAVGGRKTGEQYSVKQVKIAFEA